MKKTILFIVLVGFYGLTIAQTNTFDASNQGWSTGGDATSLIPSWQPVGGNPDGWIRVTDAKLGGLWYFVASTAYSGNKCDAYGKYLRYDQFTSDTLNQFTSSTSPEVVLDGGGITLVFNNALNPQLTWTHYDLLLAEGGGWQVGAYTGPPATEAQIRVVLSDVTSLRIRGEYRSSDDFGGLDNVVLESNFLFTLDANDPDGDFLVGETCLLPIGLLDTDAALVAEERIDSIAVKISFAEGGEFLQSAWVSPGSLTLVQHTPGYWTLVNATGTASASDFLQAILLLQYNNGLTDLEGDKFVEFRVFTECGLRAVRYAKLDLIAPPYAGEDADSLVCADAAPVSLLPLLGPDAQPGGVWTGAGGTFNPTTDASGVIRYVVPERAGCPADTAFVTMEIQGVVDPGFSDTTLCYGESLRLEVPAGLDTWQWLDGSISLVFTVFEPGVYGISGQSGPCSFSEEVVVDFYNCKPCIWYAPNVFSPNDDGVNDRWQVFVPCAYTAFTLEVYDRWGSRLFSTNDPETSWDGRDAQPGVYVWHMRLTGDLLGEEKVYEDEGDVTVVR